jgi:predicted lipoprotein with Yx(FWY)xxD motif
VDSKNATVHEFADDHDGKSTCTGDCATVWPPVVAPDTPALVPAGVTGQLGSATRDDGSKRLTVADG